MRVTTRAKNQSARARLGSQIVGLGLTTALAFAFAAPASAQQLDAGLQLSAVEPMLVDGNPDCEDLLPGEDFLFEADTDNAPVEGERIELSTNGLTGGVTITDVRTEPEGQVFDFEFDGDFAAAAVIVKGGPDANLYDYRPLGGIVADEGLHAPIVSSGDYADLSHVAFCVIENEYDDDNGNGNGNGNG
ncbi:hypothetical protein [Streptomyces sp. SYSU K21746]